MLFSSFLVMLDILDLAEQHKGKYTKMNTNLKVLTFNVKNLYTGPRDTKIHPPRPKTERSLSAIAETIDRADADVVTLQEIFSKETLEESIMTRRGLADKYPHMAYERGNDKRGIQVVTLSKYPITKIVTHKDSKVPFIDGSGAGKFSRDLLRVDIDMDNNPETTEATVYTTHLKSRRPAGKGEVNSDVRRASEGRAIGQIVREEMKEFPNRFYAVTGDMNDGPNDRPLKEIRNGQAGDVKLLDSLDHLKGSARDTWPTNPKRSRFGPVGFDHILYEEKFDKNLVSSEILRYEASDDPNSDTWSIAKSASDHFPVLAEFELSKS